LFSILIGLDTATEVLLKHFVSLSVSGDETIEIYDYDMSSSSRPVSQPESSLSLSRVLGLTVTHGRALASVAPHALDDFTLSLSPHSPRRSDTVYYAAGSVVVAFDQATNKQTGFFASTGKPVASLALSPNGRFLAIGERGHLPCILVYDLHQRERQTATPTASPVAVAVLQQSHKHGVGCLAFSPCGKYLVSVGFKHDKQLCLWDWAAERQLSTQRLTNKVYSLCFSTCGKFFVTAGEKHLKWWLVTEVLDGEAVGLEGKPASIVEEMRYLLT
jgi:mitogen-activated protein kinase binding protein 1